MYWSETLKATPKQMTSGQMVLLASEVTADTEEAILSPKNPHKSKLH
jgi:hypothetical protein